eukprot:2931199-Pleurochrysis_carterae.AAC.3
MQTRCVNDACEVRHMQIVATNKDKDTCKCQGKLLSPSAQTQLQAHPLPPVRKLTRGFFGKGKFRIRTHSDEMTISIAMCSPARGLHPAQRAPAAFIPIFRHSPRTSHNA